MSRMRCRKATIIHAPEANTARVRRPVSLIVEKPSTTWPRPSVADLNASKGYPSPATPAASPPSPPGTAATRTHRGSWLPPLLDDAVLRCVLEDGLSDSVGGFVRQELVLVIGQPHSDAMMRRDVAFQRH